MLDFFVASAIILIATIFAGIPLHIGILIILFFGVAWLLIDD